MLRKPGLLLAAAAAAAAVGVPLAMAAPAASPSDTGGYLDSTARCTAPDVAVLFGTTQTSRVAICKTAAGAYEYRGVRISDGAKLVAAAEQTSATSYSVGNDGVTYTVTPTALSVTANGDTFRTETWTDFHGAESPATSTGSAAAPNSTAPSSKSAASAPSASSASTPNSAASTPKATTAPSSAVPLPPPMAAEVGGSTGSSEG